ncbi:hypothetical protein ID866_9763 [Astraeus odoratus]|nr:hypothetical protein ID866_9763 [Astraeus odoratus]
MASSLPSKTWIAHLETKQWHFRSATQYRKSIDELEENICGDELRRLMDAGADSKRGYNLAKRCSAAPAVIQDIKSLVDGLQVNLVRAQRDNDLICHQDVPASSVVDAIQDVVMVKNNVPPGLLDPGTVIGGIDAILFGDMLSWAAREAAMDILDSEASEDESARKHLPMSRPLSHEANQELVAKQQRYHGLVAAGLALISVYSEVLEDIVPSSTVVVLGGGAATTSQTQIHARVLQGHLESLDQLIEAASRFDRWEELTPEMFVDVSDGGLAKYDRFIQGLAEGQKKQEGILETIKFTNERFLLSRKDDPAVKQREIVLHDLDMAYAKYREITCNLDEGRKIKQFYNEMASILSRFKEACRLWSNQRSQEAQSLCRSLGFLSIHDARSRESTYERPTTVV